MGKALRAVDQPVFPVTDKLHCARQRGPRNAVVLGELHDPQASVEQRCDDFADPVIPPIRDRVRDRRVRPDVHGTRLRHVRLRLLEVRTIVPRDAWLEGLINAIIHRSYGSAGDHIRVEIFPNRIEIESPGRFPGLPSLARPSQITRFARNPRIARICADLRIGQELGEGIKRIFDEMKFGGLAEPIYKQTSTSVRLILPGEPAERG